jgi:hypothetical protein
LYSQRALSLAFGVYWMRGSFRCIPRSFPARMKARGKRKPGADPAPTRDRNDGEHRRRPPPHQVPRDPRQLRIALDAACANLRLATA